MTVSSRKTADGIRWRYDFERGGQRYTSPTGFKTRAQAERAEREHKRAVERGEAPAPPRKQAKARRESGGPITVAKACALYWQDVARHLRSARDIENRLGIVRRLLGDDTLLADIRFAEVNAAIQARRAEPSRYNRPLSPAAVNRDLIDTFRPARQHAALVHELALPAINWGKLRLKERGELVREFSLQEIDRWARELADPAEVLYLATALTYGARRGELYFPPEAIKLDAPGGAELELGRYLSRSGEWRTSRKDGSLHTVTLAPDDAAALAAQAARAKQAGAEHLWVDAAGKPISYYAMGHRLKAAANRAGIEPGRIIHGARHHAATAMTRAGGIALAQRLLGHRKITTTQRYAHVSNDDLRAAVGRAQRPALAR